MSLPATSLLAGLFSVAMVLLSVQISVRRFKTGIAAGDGGEDRTLRRRVRAHGNFIEYAPTALLATGLVEYAAGVSDRRKGATDDRRNGASFLRRKRANSVVKKRRILPVSWGPIWWLPGPVSASGRTARRG